MLGKIRLVIGKEATVRFQPLEENTAKVDAHNTLGCVHNAHNTLGQ